MDDEFLVHLFSNSDVYGSNTLSSFTNTLQTPINLGENHGYRVSCCEILFPSMHITDDVAASKDCIVFKPLNYTKLNGGALSFDDFIELTLRFYAADCRIYNKEYFYQYLNESIDFHPLTLPLTSMRQDQTTILDENTKLSFPLEIDKLVLPDETKSDFYPQGDFDNSFFTKSYVSLGTNQGYKLRQILYACLAKILEKFRLEYKTDKESKPIYDTLSKNYSNKRLFGEVLQKSNHFSNILLRRFIRKFVTSVENAKTKIFNENNFVDAPLTPGDMFVIYCDLVDESYFANGKSRVLSVFPTNVNNFLAYKSHVHDFVPITKSLISSISIKVTDNFGNTPPFRDGFNSTYIALKFKKFSDK